MSTPYSGTSVYPVSYVIPDDGEAIDATSVNVALEALGDRTAFLLEERNAALASAALDWMPRMDAPAYDNVKFRHNNALGRNVFYASSSTTNDVFNFTGDYREWPPGVTASSEITAGARWASPIADFDVDAAGNVVVWSAGLDQLSLYDAGIDTWTKQTSGTGVDPDKATVAVNPATGHWCVVSGSGGVGNMFLATSSNRTTWTPRTLPAGMPAGTTGATVVFADGMMLMQGFEGTNVYFARSLDDGVTWSAVTVHALGFTVGNSGYYWPRITWSGREYYATTTNLAGSDCKVFRSTDGLVWTQTTTLARSIRYIAALDPVVIGLVGSSGVAISMDRGSTWAFGDVELSSPGQVQTAGVRFVAAGAGWASVTSSIGRLDNLTPLT